MSQETPPIIDYEGSDYQTSFWEKGNRQYEDLAEAIALKRLLPPGGKRLLELGAGAGRNTKRYEGYDQIVLLDYSLSQLKQAQDRLGKSQRYLYVAGDVYRLPFVSGLFDGATMIRVLHHMADPSRALREIRRVLENQGTFILEFANKQNLKAILRYWTGGQEWNPFTQEPVEFVDLNYDFHPRYIREELEQADFSIQRQLTVSHFRIPLLKKIVPASILATLDSLVQLTGDYWQLSPSVFVHSRAVYGEPEAAEPTGFFRCPHCGSSSLEETPQELSCPECSLSWPLVDGIYDFRDQD